MDNEERVLADKVIAESNKSLVVQALEEANDELRQEIARLRNTNRILRVATSTVRRKAEDLMNQIEETNQHLFEMVQEEELVDAEPPSEESPIDDEMQQVRRAGQAKEILTREWVNRMYQEMRNEGRYPESFPLSPAEIYAAAQKNSDEQTS